MKIVKFIKLSRFFFVESLSYIKPWKFKDVVYLPIAYYRFMSLSLND